MNARRISGRQHSTPVSRYGVAGGVVTQAELSGGVVTGAEPPSGQFSLQEPAGWAALYVLGAVGFLLALFIGIGRK